MDDQFMEIALHEAKLALEQFEVPVGCVFVDSETSCIIGKGHNKTNQLRNGTCHAEMVAIDDIILIQKRPLGIFQTCDLYVTCEPCIMCAAALAKLGIRHVYFGCSNDRFGGNGSILSVHIPNQYGAYCGYSVTSGVKGDEAVELFKTFYTQENHRAPIGKRKLKQDTSGK